MNGNDDSTAEATVFKAHKSTLPPMVVVEGSVATDAEIEAQVELEKGHK